jgi:hypothetical protein
VTQKKSFSNQRFKLRAFAKWAKGAGITDDDLLAVIAEMDRGLLGDRLGAHVYKERLRVDGRGKRSGARTIVLYRAGVVVLFMYGYLKNDNDDMSENEVQQVRLFAQQFLTLSVHDKARLCAEGRLLAVEVRI